MWPNPTGEWANRQGRLPRPALGGLAYTYNDRDELTRIDYPGADYVSFAYNDSGALTQMVDGTGTTAYSYDNLYRLTSVAFPGSRTVSYGYDDAGRRTSITYPGSTNQVTYGYDNANRLTSVTDWGSNAIAYAYDDAGRMTTKTLPAGTGVVSSYTYDNADRLTAISHVKGGSTTLASVSYTLDDVGNRTQRVDQQGTHTYAYDDVYRLTSVTYPGPSTTSYTFDAFGNRTSMTVGSAQSTYAYDDADRLTTVTPPSPAPAVNYTWDNNGNLTGRGSDTFAWDYEDRMTSATVSGTTTTFAYRGDGLRNSRTTGGNTTTFTWDIAAGLPVVIDDGNQYVYGVGLESMIVAASRYYYLADGLGSTMKTVDATGTVVNAYTYDVYGKKTSSSGSQSNEYDFAGQQTDGTGLQYLRARYMDPETGTFISREPLALRPAWTGNHFAYAGGNPALKVDPSGHRPVDSDYPAGDCKRSGCDTDGPFFDGKDDKPVGNGGNIWKDAAEVIAGVVDSSADAVRPPYTLNDLLTGVQLADLFPVGPICIGFGATSGGIVSTVCVAADHVLNLGATVASAIQLLQSSCGWNDWQTYAYAGAVTVNLIANTGQPVPQAGVEGAMYAIQTALLNTSECQGSTSLVGDFSIPLKEKP